MSVYIKSKESENWGDGNRTYIVTVKFKMSGFLPDRVTEEHIKSNIQAEIRDAISEVALSSEYYGDEDDDEWGIYLEDDVNIEMEKVEIRICESPSCEHCGERYTDFGVEIFDGGTWWCLDCYLSGDNNLSEEDIKEIRKKTKELRQKYLLKELHKLEKDDEE